VSFYLHTPTPRLLPVLITYVVLLLASSVQAALSSALAPQPPPPQLLVCYRLLCGLQLINPIAGVLDTWAIIRTRVSLLVELSRLTRRTTCMEVLHSEPQFYLLLVPTHYIQKRVSIWML
jgi:hypothetical protein